MGINSRQIKERAIEFEDQYDEAKTEAMRDFLNDNINDCSWEDIERELPDMLTNFEFPDCADWCYTQVDNELADIGDQQRDLERDREWEEQDDLSR